MKIFINGRFLTHKVTGVQRYAIEIVKIIDQIAQHHCQKFEFVVLYPKRSLINTFETHNLKFIPVGLLTGHAWEQIDLPRAASGNILLNLCGTAPVFHRKSVNILHDATAFAMPQAFSKIAVLWYRLLQPIIARQAWILGTVSNFSQKELTHYLKLGKKEISILPNGFEHVKKVNPDLNIIKGLGVGPLGYIVTIASNQPNKNVVQLLRIAPGLFLKFGLVTLVIGGSFKALAGVNRLHDQCSECVIFTGYLSDQEVAGILSQSFCFIFPSKYEGFGIPPLEAMALGVPVITTTAASLPEVCGEAALYFHVDDDQGLLESIERLTIEPELREKLRILGLQQVSKFSWQTTTQKLLRLISDHCN